MQAGIFLSLILFFFSTQLTLHFLDLDQVLHLMNHPPDHRRILVNHRMVDAAQSQRPHRSPVVAAPANQAFPLRYFELQWLFLARGRRCFRRDLFFFAKNLCHGLAAQSRHLHRVL